MPQLADGDEAKAFPLRTRLRAAVATSILLSVIGGVAFLGLLRLSSVKVFKSIVVFGEGAPWPDAEAPLAIAVRTLESGRVAAPDKTGLVIRDRSLEPTFVTKESVAFALPVEVNTGTLQGRADASALMLDTPPLAFTIGPAAPRSAENSAGSFEGLGRLIRRAPEPRDEVAAPIVGHASPACADLASVIPLGGVAQQRLASTLLVRLTDAAGVARAGVALELLGTRLGAQPSRRAAALTSNFGLAELSAVLDGETAYLLRWRCGEALVTASLQLPLLTDGMAASWPPAIASPALQLRIATNELRDRATWQADVFCGGRWTATSIEQVPAEASQFEVSLPRSVVGQLCLFQASNQPYLSHPQQASTWLLPAQDGVAWRTGSLELFDAMQLVAQGQLAQQLGPPTRALLAASDDRTLRAGLGWMLSWLPRRFEQRPLLADSRARDLAAASSYKRLWGTRFRIALASAVAGLVMIWVPASIARLLADDRTARAAADDVTEGVEPSPRLTRSRSTIALLLLAVLLGIAALVALVWVVA